MASSRVPRLPSLLRVHPRRLLVAPRIEAPQSGGEAVEVPVAGMMCAVCAARTGDALRSVPGVEAVAVDFEAQRATVRFAPGTDAVTLRDAMQEALDGVVVGVRARRWVERAARRVRGLAA